MIPHSRVWSVSRTISPHREDLRALTTGGENFRAFLPILNVLPECDVPRARINREATRQRRRHLSSLRLNELFFRLEKCLGLGTVGSSSRLSTFKDC